MAPTVSPRIDQQTVCPPSLFLACELGVHTWKLGCTPGAAQRPRDRQVAAGDGQQVREEIERAKQRCGLPAAVRVVSGDEAGRDGWWLPRFVATQGGENCVVDSASIAGHRRHRRAKTDRLDVHNLLTMLLRQRAGERKVWSGGRVPSIADAESRQLPRELLSPKRDRTRVIHRLQGLLAGCGVRLTLHGDVAPQREQVRQWDGSPLPPAVRARLPREWQQAPLLTEQLDRLETGRRAAWRTSEAPAVEQVRQVMA